MSSTTWSQCSAKFVGGDEGSYRWETVGTLRIDQGASGPGICNVTKRVNEGIETVMKIRGF